MTNKEISAQFSLLAKLMDIHGENSFKSKSYANAAFAIGKLPYEIEEVGIEAVEGEFGIGKGAISAILQIMDEGEFDQLKQLKSKTPEGILQLLSIRGIGAKKIGQLWKELKIDNPGDLLQACEENRLTALKGFGAKTQKTIQDGLEFFFSNQGSLLWSQADQLMPQIEHLLLGLTQKCKNVGEVYWQNQTVSSLDFVLGENVINQLDKQDWELIEQIDNTYKFTYKGQLTFTFYVEENDFEKMCFVHSFSQDLQSNIPWQQLTNFVNEEQAFEQLKMQFMPSFLRNNPEALSKSVNDSIPRIITEGDIKGVIHNHTTWSDGVHSIKQMAEACIEKGYEYFVLSDHSKTSVYAGGLTIEQIWAQQKEIDKLNQELKPFRIYKSIECDILGDGSLDYDDDILQTFDLVICSVHQNLKMSEEKAMTRLIKAIENPFTSILGHCTGRLLLSRAGYPIDHKMLIDACAANEVVIEINANPRRLDIDWRWIDYCQQKDVLLSINPDAHRTEGIDDIRYGVSVAQKGMLQPSMNLSSFNLDEFEEFLMLQHQKRV